VIGIGTRVLSHSSQRVTPRRVRTLRMVNVSTGAVGASLETLPRRTSWAWTSGV